MARFVIEMSDEEAATAPKKGRFVIEPAAQQKTESVTAGGLPFRPFGIDTGLTMPEGASNFAAGMGKAFADIGRGVGQMVGAVSRKDIEEARKLDAPLMETTGGTVGNIVGNVAALVPTAFIPGANTLTGAATIGAVTGLAQPSAGTGETVGNTILGGVAGPVANLAGRTVGAAYQGGKALVEPFFEGGQNRIAARTLQHFAKDPAAAAAAARAAQASVTGAQPTLAEATKDVGLAQLQRGLQSADPVGFATDLAERQMANNASRVAVLRNIAGDDTTMQAAVAARDTAAKPLYNTAKAAMAKSDDGLMGILSRPSASKAWERAQQLAAERGENLVIGTDIPEQTIFVGGKTAKVPGGHHGTKTVQLPGLVDEAGNPITMTQAAQSAQYSGKGLHYLKMAMDDMLDDASGAIGKNEQSAIRGTREQLLSWMDANLPGYGTARSTYADMSKPINQMEVGQRILNKYASASNDLAGNPKLRAEALNRALQDEEKLVRQATGFNGSGGLDSVFTPEQIRAVRSIADELSTVGAVEAAARTTGSPTAQNLASQNVLRQLIGPTGLPETWAENALLMTLARPMQWAAKAGEPKITNRLAEAMLNPRDAATLLEMASVPTVSQQFGRRVLPWIAPVATGVANTKE
jgi:hypothetical protein